MYRCLGAVYGRLERCVLISTELAVVKVRISDDHSYYISQVDIKRLARVLTHNPFNYWEYTWYSAFTTHGFHILKNIITIMSRINIEAASNANPSIRSRI